jgi:hypothetical protein
MPTARYKFVRNTNMAGFQSRNRASTDALKAIQTWSSASSGRSAEEPIVDEADTLVVDLTWSETDGAAGPDLDVACDNVGVARSHVRGA